MEMVANRQQHLFIVRMWQEPSEAAPPGQWRGSVEHVSSGQRFYFSALNDLTNFFDHHLHSSYQPSAEKLSAVSRQPSAEKPSAVSYQPSAEKPIADS